MYFLKKLLGIGLLGLITLPTVAEPNSCHTIRLAETGWADISATTSLVSVVGEGLGYKVTAPVISVPIAFTSTSMGKIDAFLGYWSPSMDGIAAPFIKNQSIIIPEAPNLANAKYTLAVPTYTYEAGLKSYNDIAKFKKELNGKIYGIEAGNDGNLLLQKMIDNNLYNVGDFKLKESSEAAMLSQVKRAIKTKKPIVFLAWEPHPMNQQIDFKYLEGGDEVFGPNYGSAKVFTIISTDYAKRCPAEADLLQRFHFSVDMENDIMTAILEHNVPPKKAAKQWLKAHPEVLDTWLTDVKTLSGEDGKTAVKAYLNH